METKINNIKEFAIGTTIDYDGKLYKVVAQTYCDNCSIANICSNNDKTSGNNITGVLSRDKRISIFGECSSIVRSDGKSVAFKEIPKTKEQNVYNELMPILIDLPDGYIIDKDNSDFDKGIIAFKNKWLTLEQVCKSAKENHYLTYRSSIKDFRDGKLINLANLMDIARYFNGDWNYDFTKECVGYSIVYCKFAEEPHYSVREIDNSGYTYYGNPVFKNEADAQYVIDNPNFRNILDKIFKE